MPAGPDAHGTDQSAVTADVVGQAAEDLARLAVSFPAPPAATFYPEFLRIALVALQGTGGAVWVRDERDDYRRQYLHGDAELPAVDRPRLEAVLRQVVQTTRPTFLAPGEPGEGACESLALGRWLLLVPVLVDSRVVGLAEVWLSPQFGNRAAALLAVLVRLVDLVGVYLLRVSRSPEVISVGAVDEREEAWNRINAFVARIHGSLHPIEVAYRITNEGRQLIGCDRLAVAHRFGRTARIQAISGVLTVQSRSELVRRMRYLCDRVLRWGERLDYDGSPDPSLPPDVLQALDDYLEESHSKLLSLLPLPDGREPREGEEPRPARSALLMECFSSPAEAATLRRRLDALALHCGTTLANAGSHHEVPLRFLWYPLARLQEGLGGKQKAIVAGVISGIVLLLAILVFVPYPLKMDSKGQLLPQERRWVYSPVEGKIVRFQEGVEPGAFVRDKQHLVLMYDVQLDQKLTQLDAEISSLTQDIAAINQRLTSVVNEGERAQLAADRKHKEELRDRRRLDLGSWRDRTHSEPSRPGQYWITAPVSGTILNSNFREELTDRQVRPSEPLIRLGNKDRPWEVELRIPQRHISHVVRAFTANAPKPELDVDLLVTSAPTRVFKGKLSVDKLAAEAAPHREETGSNSGEAEPVVLASVRIDGPGIAPEDRIPADLLVSGTEVHAKIRCGAQPMGYSLFHGLWEYFFEKVVFFF